MSNPKICIVNLCICFKYLYSKGEEYRLLENRSENVSNSSDPLAPLNFLYRYYIHGIIFRDYSVTVQCYPLKADHHNEPLHCLLHFFDLSLLLRTNRKKWGKKYKQNRSVHTQFSPLGEGRERKCATVDTLVTLHDLLVEDTPILWVMRAA